MKVELLTRAIAKEGFPFVMTTIKADVVAGKTATLEFGVPPSTSESPGAPRATRAYVDESKQKIMGFVEDDLNDADKRYDEDPIVAPLNRVLLNLSVTPPSQPGVYASLPDSMRGGRELDARQIGSIVDRLESEYSFDDQGALQRASAANPQLADLIAEQIASHNKRVSRFREIVKALDEVKRQ